MADHTPGLNGATLGLGGVLASQAGLLTALEGSANASKTAQANGAYYPPALTGMRGSYDATYRCVIGRQPFGRITIANSDAGAKACTDVAIDQAWRAAGEIKS